MKNFFALLFFIWTCTAGASHVVLPADSIVPKKNSVFVEAGGRSLMFCVGYERTLLAMKKFSLNMSGGFSFLLDPSLNFPVSIELNYGKGKNKLNIFLCAVNNFDRFPSSAYFKEKRKAKAEGWNCPPEFVKAYQNAFSAGAGYRRMLAKSKISAELYCMGYWLFYCDKDYTINTCKHYVGFAPWGGIKFNFYV